MSHKSQSRARRAGVLVAAAAAAGTLSTFTPASAVVGGVAADGSYASTVRLAIGDNFRVCTGALVDRYWVMTAASCFSDDPAQPQALAAGAPKWKTTATVGRTDLASAAGVVADVVELAPRQDRDLVLARLATPVDGIAPLTVATTAPTAGETLRVPGFGRTKDEWVPTKLHTGAFTLDSVSPTGIGVTGTGGAAICKGDTGAPAIRELNGKAELVAVASRSWQGGCLGTPATETRTGASESRVDDLGSWIDQVRGGWLDTLAANPAARSSVYDPVRKIATVFAVDSKHHVVFSYSKDGKTWSDWAQLPAGNWEFASAPTAVFNSATNAIELFAIGTDGVLSQTYWMDDSQGWRGWYTQDQSLKFVGSPTAVYNPATKTAEVFATKDSGIIAHSYYTAGTSGWAGWFELGDWQFAGTPSAVYNPATGGIELFAIGRTDGVLSQTYWMPDAEKWRGWRKAKSATGFTGSPTSVYNPVTRTAEVFATRTNGIVAHSYYTPDMSGWSDFADVNSRQFAGTPTAVFDPATGGFDLFAVDGNGILARAEWRPGDSKWRDWASVGDWKFTTGRFPTAAYNPLSGLLDVFATGQNGVMNHVSYKADRQGWNGWETVNGGTVITG